MTLFTSSTELARADTGAITRPMCGRFTLTAEERHVEKRFGAKFITSDTVDSPMPRPVRQILFHAGERTPRHFNVVPVTRVVLKLEPLWYAKNTCRLASGDGSSPKNRALAGSGSAGETQRRCRAVMRCRQSQAFKTGQDRIAAEKAARAILDVVVERSALAHARLFAELAAMRSFELIEPEPMASALENLRQAQARGRLERVSDKDLAEFVERLITRYMGVQQVDEAEARRLIAVWIQRDAFKREFEGEFTAWLATKKAGPRPSSQPSSEAAKLLQAVAGAVIGGLAGAAISLLIHATLSSVGRVRVPAGMILVFFSAPIVGIILGAIVGWQFDARDANGQVRRYHNSATVYDRAWMAWGVGWTAVVLIAFTVFDPFNRYAFRYWYPGDQMKFLLIWVGPIVGGWLVTRLVRWVARGQPE